MKNYIRLPDPGSKMALTVPAFITSFHQIIPNRLYSTTCDIVHILGQKIIIYTFSR